MLWKGSVLGGFCLLQVVSTWAQSADATKPVERKPAIELGGLLQVQLDVGDQGDSRFTDDNDRFYLRRARLNATGTLFEELDFRLEMDLAGGLSNTSSLRAQMTDGYIHWNRCAAANVRAGQFKTPFGFEQLYGDPRLLTIERSLMNDRLTAGRQIGAQVGGDLLEKRLSYAVGTFNGNNVNNNYNDDDRFFLAGRLSGVPWQGGLGGSATWSVGGDAFSSQDANVPLSDFGFDSTPATPDRDGIFSGERKGVGLDTQLVAERFELWAEYLRVRFEPDSGVPSRSFDADGWYGQGSYFVIPDRLQIVLKYETFDPNSQAEADATDTATAGANLYLKGHDVKLMLDYLRVDAPAPADSQDKVIARLQIVF
ncbi:MAG TPA: porin [Thermoanaerobaculia bacterium]|nr:porin [Thermoanaerobaculia bacterium]